MDVSFQPIWDGDRFVCTICFFTVKSMYKGRADIVDAKKYIDEHWMDEFNQDAVAKAVNISPSHLRSLFKQHAGETMQDYYKKVKIDHIKEKLTDKNITVAQAFSYCGADSQGQMAKIFKELTGMTPKQYRNSLK
jgi:AraC-like DNA-binding protein